MQRSAIIFIIPLLCSLTFGCSSYSNKNWTDFIHEETSFLLIADPGMKVSDITNKEYFSYLDDLTASPIQQLSSIDFDAPASIQLKALALYPATSTESHLLWIGELPNANIKDWAPNFYQPFSQNNYTINGFTIHRLFINEGDIFATQVGHWLLLSKSSLVVENAIRTSVGKLDAIDLSEEPSAGSVVLNTPHLDSWLHQVATIDNRPSLLDVFKGTKPVVLNFSASEDSLDNISITGNLELESNDHSVLTDAYSFENKPIRLDRHIASNAAAFAILRLPPTTVPVEPEENQQSKLDSVLLNNLELYQQLAETLDSELAFVALPESGLLEAGELLILRALKNKNSLVSRLDRLVQDEIINKVQSTYHINGTVFSDLIGSEMNDFRDFYLSFSGDVAVIAKRRGLAESVNSDRTRRRVIYYDDIYSDVRENLPRALSGFVWASSNEFMEFIQPFLNADNVAGSLISRFDIIAMTMVTNNSNVDLAINTFSREGSLQPYEELWVVPFSDFNLNAKPVLGDIVGSSTNEIIFSTTNGDVYVLAADGTVILQSSTNGLQPIGSPILYDWYGNGQQVILLPAGNKVFAWNSTGQLLPQFPIELDANVSSPILVVDVLRNGVPEIVVATEDRKVHVLNGRGENVRGWPQNTNTPVTSAPVYELFEGSWSVWAFSENALHSWTRNGSSRAEYPQFINAQFTGSPVLYENQVLGSAADGYLYSIGEEPFFADSADVEANEVNVNSIYVAGSELTSVSIEENVLLRDDSGFYREDLITTQSRNGSVFMYNKEGQLRFTQSLGQPASPTLTPHLIDIDADKNMDLMALAEFGRLYAWEVLTNQRLYGIPTSGMKYPITTDLNGDGQMELIAQTREGLRSWTINRVD